MLKPLEEWICDRCGEVIESAQDGYMIWKRDGGAGHSFKIIHHVRCDAHDHSSSLPLRTLVGPSGLSHLLSLMTYGPVKNNLGERTSGGPSNPDEFADLIRRLHVPYYEEARQSFSNSNLLERLADSNEMYPYQPDVLQGIAENYRAV